eukprot:UN2982
MGPLGTIAAGAGSDMVECSWGNTSPIARRSSHCQSSPNQASRSRQWAFVQCPQQRYSPQRTEHALPHGSSIALVLHHAYTHRATAQAEMEHAPIQVDVASGTVVVHDDHPAASEYAHWEEWNIDDSLAPNIAKLPIPVTPIKSTPWGETRPTPSIGPASQHC